MFSFFPSFYILSAVFLFYQPSLHARPQPITEITVTNHNTTRYNLHSFLHASRGGSHFTGLSGLKKYLHRLGHLPATPSLNFSDEFDANFVRSIRHYQTKLGLPVTGILDSDTLSEMAIPRCGVPDNDKSSLTRYKRFGRYAYFKGEPRWDRKIPIMLTYGFSPENLVKCLSLKEIRGAFRRAFDRWESVIPVNFTETEDYGFADIKIGFYNGDHGDGEPFDGVVGILAHAFSPESGRFHLDAAEMWSVNFELQKSDVAVDLESVATHEIGHLLGLSHSSDKEAVMYPSLKPRDKKLDLKMDDIKGVQALYGSNPNFKVEALFESDTSSSDAIDLRIGSSIFFIPFVRLVLILWLCT